jgi:hypothetical protein
MAVRKVGPKGPEFPPPERGPQVSSTLAKNIADASKAARAAVMYHGKTDLSGRVDTVPAGKPIPRTVIAGNMLRWRGW